MEAPARRWIRKGKKKIKTPKIAVNRPPVRNEDKASIDDVEKNCTEYFTR